MRKTILLMIIFAAAAAIVYSCGSPKAADQKKGAAREEGHKGPKMYTVVIDPGHGGRDKGATGASGAYEKDFTLQLSKKLMKLLEKEELIEAYMTRSDDSFISSVDRERVKIAIDKGADLLLSIHGNTYTDAKVSGTETYYFTEQSRTLAEVIHKHAVKATGFRDRGVKVEDFFIIKDAPMPSVLLELGYLTNPQNEAQLLKEEVQNEIAKAIVTGLKEYMQAARSNS